MGHNFLDTQNLEMRAGPNIFRRPVLCPVTDRISSSESGRISSSVFGWISSSVFGRISSSVFGRISSSVSGQISSSEYGRISSSVSDQISSSVSGLIFGQISGIRPDIWLDTWYQAAYQIHCPAFIGNSVSGLGQYPAHSYLKWV